MATTLTPIIAKAATSALTPPVFIEADRDGFPLQGTIPLRSGTRTTGAPDLALPVTLLDTSATRTITFTAADVINAQGKFLWFISNGVSTNAWTVTMPSAIMYRSSGAVCTSAASNTTTNGASLCLYVSDASHVFPVVANNITFS